MEEYKRLLDKNGQTDFYIHVGLFTGIKNISVYEYINGKLV